MQKACFSAILVHLWPVLSFSGGLQSTPAQSPVAPINKPKTTRAKPAPRQ